MIYFLRFLMTILLLLVFSFSQTIEEPSIIFSDETQVNMLQHNVYFFLKEDITAKEMQQFENGLQELLTIEEIYKSQIGTPAPTPERDVTDHSFNYSVFSWFKSMEDYNIYAQHPVHMKFIDEYSHLWTSVKVYDSEIIQTNE